MHVSNFPLFEIKVIVIELLVGVMGIILLILPFLMPTTTLRVLTIFIFLLFCIFGYYLIKAPHQESKRREEAERLAAIERTLREEAEKMAIRERDLRLATERLSRARDQFILSSQHYFRTPLTSSLIIRK